MQEAVKALVAAQNAMTAAHKGKVNPHFKNKYATLSDVMDACLPALRENGFALMQPIGIDERGQFVETHLIHESGHTFSSRVHLILSKNDMQGFGSAVTYARRYGLGALAGITDTDDDGHEASKKKPKAEARHDPETGELPPGQGPSHGKAIRSAFEDGIRDSLPSDATERQFFEACGAAMKDQWRAYKTLKGLEGGWEKYENLLARMNAEATDLWEDLAAVWEGAKDALQDEPKPLTAAEGKEIVAAIHGFGTIAGLDAYLDGLRRGKLSHALDHPKVIAAEQFKRSVLLGADPVVVGDVRVS